MVAGLAFGLAQFVAANYVSVQLTDIIASLVSAAAVVLLLRVWTPVESPDLDHEQVDEERVTVGGGHRRDRRGGRRPRRRPARRWRTGPTGRASAGTAPGPRGERPGTGNAGSRADDLVLHDSAGEIAKAYAPYLIIIAIFSVANLSAVKDALAKEPFTTTFQWPGLDVVTSKGEPAVVIDVQPQLGAGRRDPDDAGRHPHRDRAEDLPRRALQAYKNTYVELRWAIVTVMAVLALAYVMNQSAMTSTLGALLAETGGLFVFLSPILGWLGVAVTGSDTSSNALFGALQVQTASQADLDPLLLAAANSSGGVLGKMISPQNLAIAAAAVGMAGQEGIIFRKVLGWSLVLLLLMCVIVVLQSSAVLGWMVP